MSADITFRPVPLNGSEPRYSVTVDGGTFIGYVYRTTYRDKWRIEGERGWHPTRQAAAEALWHLTITKGLNR